MPVLDGNFEAFVTNLGKYNEGQLVGEWVKFPTTEEEMQKVFERIGIGSTDEFGQPYEEWFITDYECPVHGVYDMQSCTVYRLYGDNTEGMVMDTSELKAHAAQGGIFGVEKVEWVAALERENPLKAAEMSMEDDYGMIDGIINNGPKEDKSAKKGEKSSIMDRLKASKSEPPKEKPTPHKERKGELEL